MRNKIKQFAAAFLITLIIMLLIFSLIYTEYKTLSLGFQEVNTIFSIENGSITINDRSFKLGIIDIKEFIKYAFAVFLIF